MNKEREISLVEEMDQKTLDILRSKRSDYADEDVLSNFKRLAEVARILKIDVHTPHGYALFMVLMKIDRISNLLSGDKKPSNESVDDSFFDGINYLKLAYLNYVEGQEVVKGFISEDDLPF